MNGMDGNTTIGYWLFYAQRCTGYAFADVLRTCCKELNKPYEVTPPQFGVLQVLFREDRLTIGAISQNRAVDAPTITGIVSRLQQHGLVSREHDVEDRRVVKVYLTEEGREITKALWRAAEEFNKVLLCNFSEEDKQEFLTRLQMIVVNLTATGTGVGDRFMVLSDQDSLTEILNRERKP